MVQQALLAGTLEDGGQVSGFVYFPHVIGRESQLTFVAQLPDATTGTTVASVTIPLVVK
jgi:hypothetical protein